MQYPVFLFVVHDYTSDGLDLGDRAVYRDLRRPIGVQDPSREAYVWSDTRWVQEGERGVPPPRDVRLVWCQQNRFNMCM